MKKWTVFGLVGGAMLALVLAGCPLPEAGGAGGGIGSLVLIFGPDAAGKSLLEPPISMAIRDYQVSGAGPHGRSFSRTTEATMLVTDNLAVGNWDITVEARNTDSEVIGAGSVGGVLVEHGETAQVSVTVTPLAGTGSLSLTVSWKPEDVNNPSVAGTLQILGTDTVVRYLTFTVDGNEADAAESGIAAGYYDLIVQLFDDGNFVAGDSRGVRILKDQTTAGTLPFEQVNILTGSVSVAVASDLKRPLGTWTDRRWAAAPATRSAARRRRASIAWRWPPTPATGAGPAPRASRSPGRSCKRVQRDSNPQPTA